MVLYTNACVRSESRTDRIARALLGKTTDKYDEIKLSEIHLQQLSEEELNKRTEYIEKGEYSNPMFDPAKQFADAEIIVIAAPYWDMSFPASLKVYLKNEPTLKFLKNPLKSAPGSAIIYAYLYAHVQGLRICAGRPIQAWDYILMRRRC